MKNIKIRVTDNRTIVVIADTKRFGKNEIMYEGRTFMECCDYIRRVCGKNKFQLIGLSTDGYFTDTEGRTMPRKQDVIMQ